MHFFHICILHKSGLIGISLIFFTNLITCLIQDFVSVIEHVPVVAINSEST
jgi:hypothetical protein